jgi:hypothetical protein
MKEWREQIDVRTVTMVVVLDVVTYVLVFWLAFPAFDTILTAMDSTMSASILHITQAVRLTVVGLFAARSYQRRRGMVVRSYALPSVLAGAVITLVLGLMIGAVSRGLDGFAQPTALEWLAAIGEGLIFPVFGLLFVNPGSAEKPLPAQRTT